MIKKFVYILVQILLFGFLINGCVSIPPEAPQLSTELGNRIARIEEANLNLLHRFFDQKRKVIDQFIADEWTPLLASKFFSDPFIARSWNTIVTENDAKQRLKFLIKVGPKLQARINNKRIELIQPLDALEREIENRIREEFTLAKAMNNSITSFLQSAAKIDANRRRYLEKAGLKDEKIGKIIDKTDKAVSGLVKATKNMPEKIEAAKEYFKKIRSIRDKN